MNITHRPSTSYNLKQILDRNKKKPITRPININDLHTEIKQQKIEILALKNTQKELSKEISMIKIL